MEYRAKVTTQLENDRAEQALCNNLEIIGRFDLSGIQNWIMGSDQSNTHDGVLFAAPVKTRSGSRQSVLLSNGMVLENVDVSKDEKEAAKYRENKQRQSGV